MSKRGWLLLVVGFLALFAWTAFMKHRQRVNESMSARISADSFKAIEPGMARAQVEHLLGGPPGQYNTATLRYYSAGSVLWSGSWQSLEWTGNRGTIRVGFDSAGTVQRSVFFRAQPAP